MMLGGGVRKSATLRLFLLHLAASVLSAGVILAAVYFGATKILESQTASVVEAELRGLVDDFAIGGRRALSATIARRTKDRDNTDSIYLYASSGGIPISGNLSRWPDVPRNGRWTKVELLRTDINKQVEIGGRAFALQGGGRLFVGRDMREQREFRELWKLASLALLVFFLLSGTFGGLAVSRTVLKRVRGVQDVSIAVERGDIARRAPVRRHGDEFDSLARSLNAMLDKNEKLVAELRMVSDSLAHDLRTPLAHLRNNLQALAANETAEIDQQILSEALSEAEYIHKVFTELLDIARADAGLAAEQFETLNLAKIVADAVDLYHPLAEEKKIELDVIAPEIVELNGHGQFIARAVANLLDNAIKFTPTGGHIIASIGQDDDGIRLGVGDTGPGLTDAQWSHALSRFGRIEKERPGRGAGLGLSLVASVATLHSADLIKAQSKTGLEVVLIFPPPG